MQATESALANNVSDQPIIPISFSFFPMPPMPETQMQPYNLFLRFGNVSKCHGCGSPFDKTSEKLYVFGRKEEHWWPKVHKDIAEKQRCLGKRTFYYCTQFSCLLARRPLLKKIKYSNIMWKWQGARCTRMDQRTSVVNIIIKYLMLCYTCTFLCFKKNYRERTAVSCRSITIKSRLLRFVIFFSKKSFYWKLRFGIPCFLSN